MGREDCPILYKRKCEVYFYMLINIFFYTINVIHFSKNKLFSLSLSQLESNPSHITYLPPATVLSLSLFDQSEHALHPVPIIAVQLHTSYMSTSSFSPIYTPQYGAHIPVTHLISLLSISTPTPNTPIIHSISTLSIPHLHPTLL